MHEAKLVKLSAQSGMPIPKEITDAPDLLGSLRLFWDCYFSLRRGKVRTQGLQWWEVQYWCDAHKLDDELTYAVHQYTIEMDNIWIGLFPNKPPPKPEVRSGPSTRNQRR